MSENKISAILGILLGIILAIAAIPSWKRPESVRQDIDFSQYIIEKDIEEEVFGVTYPQEEYDSWVPEFIEMEMTYYTDRGLCADGITVAHEGVCAVQKELIGMTAIVYSLDEELIGIYECCDTGYGRREANGKGTIENGHCIDIFFDEDAEGKQFIRKHGNKVKVYFIEANG